MGWNPFAWLFGEQEEPSKRERQEKREKHGKQENQSEQLVLGAELHCPYGSENSYLIVPAGRTCINGLPRACVLDRKELENIQPFGQCALGGPCEDLMELEERWENPEPQKVSENGEEIITTKSTLICKKNWIIISAVTSGQDGAVMELWREQAEQAEWERGIEEKYPGLLTILMDPYGSLYLNEGMYQTALRFLEDCIAENGGEIPLADVYVPASREMMLMKAALAHLLPGIDTKRQESFLSVLEARGVATNMYDSPGWDAHLLNGAMMDMLKKDCANTAELIETKPFYRWQEENKQSLSIVADSINDFTYALVIYNSMMLASQNKVCSRDSWLNKGANKIKNAAKKVFSGEAEAGAGGGPETNFESEILSSGEEGDKFLQENYGSENVVWESEGGTGVRGKLTGSLDGLTSDERTVINELLDAGNDVEIIPRSDIQNVQTPDFYVNGVKTELKTLKGSSLNTPVTRIQEGFGQGAETVIIDARKTGMTLEQADNVMKRVSGIYKNTLPGIVEIWTKEGIIRR